MKLLPHLFIVLVLSIACGSSKPSGQSNSDISEKEAPRPATDLEPFYCDDIAELEDLEDSSVFSTTNILSYELIRGCACIKYEYSGCREGERLLAWNGEWNESNRPEVMMKLLVRDAGMCDQLFTDSTCFSLKKMKFVGNEILVFLNNKNNSLLLDYNDAGYDLKED